MKKFHIPSNVIAALVLMAIWIIVLVFVDETESLSSITIAVSIVVALLLNSSVKRKDNYKDDSIAKAITIPTNTVMVKCPKCGKLVNSANDHCPDCFSDLHSKNK